MYPIYCIRFNCLKNLEPLRGESLLLTTVADVHRIKIDGRQSDLY